MCIFSLGGLLGTVATQPLDLLKTRMQSSNKVCVAVGMQACICLFSIPFRSLCFDWMLLLYTNM